MALSLQQGAYAILHIRAGPPYPDSNSPIIASFELSQDFWIERLPENLAIKIQRACEPPHHRIDKMVHDRHLYAFMRALPERQTVRHDGLEELLTVVALSRLIEPTTTGDRYCATILPHQDNDPTIEGLTITARCSDVYISDGTKDWLSPNNGLELQKMMPWISKSKKMYDRVHRAYWHHEEAMRSYFLDRRFPLVVAGLESLVNIEKYRDVSKRFVRRTKNLAIELGIDLSPEELDKAFSLRSELAHAQNFLFGLHYILPPDQHRPLYDKLESLLRLAVKQSLLDETFGAYFTNDDTVRAKWDTP
jgi:hypothetical protein